MALKEDFSRDDVKLSIILDKIPVGVTVIDLEGRILYYNQYSSQIVDRRPEYIGKDIRACHEKAESVAKIDRMLQELKDGNRQKVFYGTVRNGKKLGITVLPYKVDGQLVGFIQSIVVKR